MICPSGSESRTRHTGGGVSTTECVPTFTPRLNPPGGSTYMWASLLLGSIPAAVIAPPGSRLIAGAVGGAAVWLLGSRMNELFPSFYGPSAFLPMAAPGIVTGIVWRLAK